MPDLSLPAHSNKYFLHGLIQLARHRDVEVVEDIYAQNGMKLIARGSRVDAGLYERVVSHKLARPIETSVAAAELPGPEIYRREAERLLDTFPFVRCICDWSNGRVSPVDMLAEMRFSPQAATLLAVAEQRMPGMRSHDVLVSLLAVGLANVYRYNDAELLAAVGIAGMFHDVGEAYVDPALLRAERPLSPREWMSYTAHPIIGAALAREVGGFDSLVQRGILEHHERLDGFGYPRSLREDAFSVAGRLVALAETLSALVQKQAPCRRIDIALKIMPGEYEPELVSLVSDLIDEVGIEGRDRLETLGDIQTSIHDVFTRIARVLAAHDMVQVQARSMSARARGFLEDVFERFVRVQRAFASTGVAGLAELGMAMSDEEFIEFQFEAGCVLDEIAWRLMKLSRELVLQSATLDEGDRRLLMLLAEAMAGGQGGEGLGTAQGSVLATL
ncbi:HD-GYP domain-containing protein [Uliginosibacterium sp. H1]|uniref:HD-GYP domain-containing protein n=1 Tax=Uliginosibacterium sp. H1 TaxID=3114757 RepID=UPI002E18F8B1|nr:HD domain-containing phosphohydrolase [Uliginosibacterium sp. H1]